jgi:SpoVK/Ycf46/Vps4 family AAA+-type ATPase
MEQSKKPEKYQLVRLPCDTWRQAGEELVLSESVRRALVRYGEWRLKYKGWGYGLLLFTGLPGVGKSVAARFTMDAAVRHTGGRGNALVIHAPSLIDEHLGKGPKLMAELFDEIALSASKVPTCVLWEDCESVMVSRAQCVKSDDPTDLIRLMAAMLFGLDTLRDVKTVLHICTCNFSGVLDEALRSRVDHEIVFGLPTVDERRLILEDAIGGLAGKRVLDELAAATEGKSGRELKKISMHAFLAGEGAPEELTPEDFLRAARINPGNGDVMPHGNGTHQPEEDLEAVRAEEMIEEAAMVAVTVTNGKEDAVCQNGLKASSRNGYQQAPSPRQTKSEAPSSWFERLQRCSTWPPLPRF